MRLLSLTLESFRSYQKLAIDFPESENISVLLGANATGKTNVLEAIAILALLKSPRKVEDSDLVAWEQSYYRVKGACLTTNGEETSLEVVSQSTPRKERACFLNGVRTPAGRYIGSLPLITFMPDHLLLFTGSPAERRRFVDDLLSQVSPSHRQAQSEYERVLRQRNSLLRQIAEGREKPATLDIWDEKLSTLGAIITVDRLQLFATLGMTLAAELRALGERPKTAHFTYVRRGKETEDQAIQRELREELLHFRERDCQILATTIGPHRDDWTLAIDGRDIATFASRGQQRAALLALLLLEASFLEVRRGEKPILLLDDVFSEFDADHQSAVLRALQQHQVIITAVQLDPLLAKGTRVVACPLA